MAKDGEQKAKDESFARTGLADDEQRVAAGDAHRDRVGHDDGIGDLVPVRGQRLALKFMLWARSDRNDLCYNAICSGGCRRS